ncbi:tyrosine-protein phosphatase [Herbidospora mongoliensis]|uniref:tyrosine-protein phosphatase n=1 Tax=Herbidospora mongoliensis TaxID=688067 RepID=UPI000A590F5A|nr:tyrosine-protein phosphatase [Herbidospora mongoliensis]
MSHLAWEGCHNTRDLGGLPLHDGGRTPHEALIRSDNPEHLTAHGVSTVVDLREAASPDLTTIRIDPASRPLCTTLWRASTRGSISSEPGWVRL